MDINILKQAMNNSNMDQYKILYPNTIYTCKQFKDYIGSWKF